MVSAYTSYGHTVRLILVIFGLSAALIQAQENEFELVSLPNDITHVENLYPMNMATLFAETQIREIPRTGQQLLDDKKLMMVIDSDRASGTSLTIKNERRFLISFKAINRFNEIVITGRLKGSTISVDFTEIPMLSNEKGWQRVIDNKPLRSPATSLLFRPRSALQAIVTLKTPSEEIEPYPIICDLAFYSVKDVREFELASNSPSAPLPRQTSSEDNPTNLQVDNPEKEKNTESRFQDKTEHEIQHNMGGMQTGARIAQVSSLANIEQTDMLHDDSAATFLEFDPREKESIAVIDLGTVRRLQKFSLVHSSHAGDLKLYSTNKLPWDAYMKPLNQTATLAWLDISILTGKTSFHSDTPLFAQFSPPPTERTMHTLRLRSSLFNQMAQFGSANTDNGYFTQLKAPVVSHRFVVARFSNRSTDTSEGFCIHDWNVFGDYAPDDFRLIPKTLPEKQQEPLIVIDPPMPVAGAETPDYSGAGRATTSPSPIPSPSPTPSSVSPSSP